jgi:hypothetical protein
MAAAATALMLVACEQPSSPPQTSPPKFTSDGLRAMPKAADGAEGSGCLADAGALPDGAWFGFVKAWDGSGVDLDPACFYTGAAAAREAAARNAESPPPNDFYIANDSTRTRRIPVSAGAAAVRVTHNAEGGIKVERTTYADLIVNSGTYQPCPDAFCAVWVYVNGGAATEVQMQYLP